MDLADLELLEASIGRAHAEGLQHRPSAALASDGSPSSPLISSSAASPRRSDWPQRQCSRLRGSDDEVSVPAEALQFRARRATGGDDAGARWSSARQAPSDVQVSERPAAAEVAPGGFRCSARAGQTPAIISCACCAFVPLMTATCVPRRAQAAYRSSLCVVVLVQMPIKTATR